MDTNKEAYEGKPWRERQVDVDGVDCACLITGGGGGGGGGCGSGCGGGCFGRVCWMLVIIFGGSPGSVDKALLVVALMVEEEVDGLDKVSTPSSLHRYNPANVCVK